MENKADSRKAAWFALAQEVSAVGTSIYAQADLTETEKGATDPRVIALSLLCRTLAHVRGVQDLVENDLIVEARTLTRCCYENLMWIDGLAAGGDDFVKKVVHADLKNREQRGKVLVEWGARQTEEPSFMGGLQEYLQRLKTDHPDRKPLSFKSIAEGGVLRDAYVIYGQLSTDSAHPSTDTLSRHLERGPDGSLHIVAEPQYEPAEIDETLQFAVGALIGVCVATNQILGSVPAASQLGDLFDKFLALRTTRREAASESGAGDD